MTLISYASRIHFANGVLEEALQSEMETHANSRPLIVTSTSVPDDEITERVLAGLPVNCTANLYQDATEITTEEAVDAVVQNYKEYGCDCLIAIGDTKAIDLAKTSRLELASRGALRTCSNFQSARNQSNKDLTKLYAVPNTLGLAAAVSPHATLVLKDGRTARLTTNSLIPTATICDPRIAASDNVDVTISAAIDAITRCIETYLSASYHPPAAGMALDGLERAVSHLEEISDQTSLETRREIMAACLNSALAQQRDLGPTQAIGNALCAATRRCLDRGALSRLILPEVLSRQKYDDARKLGQLRRILNLEANGTLKCGVERIFDPVPFPKNLTEFGLSENDLEVAADIAANDMALVFGASFSGTDEMLAVMHAVR